MPIIVLILLVLGLGAVGWLAGRFRAAAFSTPHRRDVHSRPGYHGSYVALSVALPTLVFLVFWAAAEPRLIEAQVLNAPAARGLSVEPMDRGAILAEASALAAGAATKGESFAERLAPAYRTARSEFGLVGLALTLVIALVGGVSGFRRLNPAFRARDRVEILIRAVLLIASLIAVLTTIGIVASLLVESIRFFGFVAPTDFLFGTRWSPQAATNGDMRALGAIPLFWGTIFIGAIIAMLVAIPLGLMSAIYLTQYADSGTRRWAKPLLEILAGIPTVVYGYFAALTVAPVVRTLGDTIGIPGASSESALAAGLVMGIMIIPFVSSMADDALTAVPQSMRDGSLAMGATEAETIRHVLLPAALPGIVGGVLLAISRAVGETMIVVMAAGFAANLTANPFASVTTVTVQIVQLLTGDQAFDSAKTLSAFALGLVLFIVTLSLNIIALVVVKRYREEYD